ncbi:MAG: hypothetical protein JWR59_2459 [Brevundimonas sp.]|nr:hypothetical protein [Brevundimonas sp.]
MKNFNITILLGFGWLGEILYAHLTYLLTITIEAYLEILTTFVGAAPTLIKRNHYLPKLFSTKLNTLSFNIQSIYLYCLGFSLASKCWLFIKGYSKCAIARLG